MCRKTLKAANMIFIQSLARTGIYISMYLPSHRWSTHQPEITRNRTESGLEELGEIWGNKKKTKQCYELTNNLQFGTVLRKPCLITGNTRIQASVLRTDAVNVQDAHPRAGLCNCNWFAGVNLGPVKHPVDLDGKIPLCHRTTNRRSTQRIRRLIPELERKKDRVDWAVLGKVSKTKQTWNI